MCNNFVCKKPTSLHPSSVLKQFLYEKVLAECALLISHLEKESSALTHSLLTEQTPEGFFKVPNNLPVHTCKKMIAGSNSIRLCVFPDIISSVIALSSWKLNLIMKIITHSIKDTKILQNSFPNGRDCKPWLKCVFMYKEVSFNQKKNIVFKPSIL